VKSIKQKTIAKWISIILFLFFISVISCEELKAHPFQIGEKLTYKIKFFAISIGEKILEVKDTVEIDGHSTYLLSSKAKTVGLTDLFFPLEDRMRSFVDIDTLYPHRIEIYFQEGNSPPKDRIVQIDQKIGIAWIEDRGKKQKWKKELPGPTLDTLSLIYWLRAQFFQVGKVFSLFLLEDGNLRGIKIKVIKQEKVKLNKENYLAFLCSEVGSDKIKIWFSSDKRHLPIKIEVATDIGIITSYLEL